MLQKDRSAPVNNLTTEAVRRDVEFGTKLMTMKNLLGKQEKSPGGLKLTNSKFLS